MRKTKFNLNWGKNVKCSNMLCLFSIQSTIVDITIAIVSTTNGFSTSIICILDNITQTIIR